MWKKTEDMVRQVLIESGINYVEVANEAAFAQPETAGVQLKNLPMAAVDAIGKSESTNNQR